MSEATFPVLGAAFVLLIVLPASALLAKAGLWLVERRSARGVLHHLHLRYVLLTASSFLPLAWFLSAGIHQAETGQSALACLLSHEEAELCLEPASFASLLLAGASVAWFFASRRTGSVQASRSSAAQALSARVDAIVAAHPALADLRGRILVTDEAQFALGTRGLLRPQVFVGTGFASNLTDSMLVSALGHEQEHVRSRDPLRYLLLQLALGINPLGRRLLAPHAARWKGAREAHCDRQAVVHGAAPLPLAHAILRAARPTAREAAALGATDTNVLQLRVSMLVAFSEHQPKPCCHESRSTMPLALAALFLTVSLPHVTGAHALDVLHTGTEQALSHVWPQ